MIAEIRLIPKDVDGSWWVQTFPHNVHSAELVPMTEKELFTYLEVVGRQIT